jgi:hypothetical protein
MVTNPPTEQPEEQRWQQPEFAPGAEPPPVLSGQVLVPGERVSGERVPPPSALETVIGVVAGLVWPVMMILGIFGPVPFWSALVIAFVASWVLGTVKSQLRAQRRRGAINPPPSQLR